MFTHSSCSDATGQGDQAVQAFLFQLEQPDLLIQRFPAVKGRTLDDPLNVFQGEFQFPEQEDLLKDLQGRIVIQPVACLRVFRRMQETDPVVILQGAYTHACQPAYLMHRHHSA